MTKENYKAHFISAHVGADALVRLQEKQKVAFDFVGATVQKQKCVFDFGAQRFIKKIKGVHLILGGAALQRCDNRTLLTAASAAEVTECRTGRMVISKASTADYWYDLSEDRAAH